MPNQGWSINKGFTHFCIGARSTSFAANLAQLEDRKIHSTLLCTTIPVLRKLTAIHYLVRMSFLRCFWVGYASNVVKMCIREEWGSSRRAKNNATRDFKPFAWNIWRHFGPAERDQLTHQTVPSHLAQRTLFSATNFQPYIRLIPKFLQKKQWFCCNHMLKLQNQSLARNDLGCLTAGI